MDLTLLKFNLRSKDKYLEIGKTKFNIKYLKSVTERKAIKDYHPLDRDHVVNAWKQANGLSVRNNRKRKAVVKKKTED